jgi:hypothetical protein
VAGMDISLPNVHMRGNMRTMIRKRIKTRATTIIRNSQRNPMDKLMSVKNGTKVIRVPSQKLMIWQP